MMLSKNIVNTGDSSTLKHQKRIFYCQFITMSLIIKNKMLRMETYRASHFFEKR